VSPRIIVAGLFLTVCGLLWWQVQQNGELKAVNSQYQATIEDMNSALIDLANRNKRTHKILADTRSQFQEARQQAWGLADDLKKQSDACVNNVISESVVNRVRQYTDDQNANRARDGPE